MDRINDNRLKEFRQLREEIRGSKEYVIVGIDVGKDKHHAFFGTATGKTLLRRLLFENNRAGFGKLLMQTEAVPSTFFLFALCCCGVVLASFSLTS